MAGSNVGDATTLHSHESGAREDTPLLSQEHGYHSDGYDSQDDREDDSHSPATSSLLQSLNRKTRSRSWSTFFSRNTNRKSQSSSLCTARWPTLLSLFILILALASILVLGFIIPGAVETYTREAADFNPTYVAIDEITDDGVRLHIKADISLKSEKVERSGIRRLGRTITWMARTVKTSPTHVEAYLPDYNNMLAGTATLPQLSLDIRDAHVNHIDIVTEIKPGSLNGLRDLGKEWLDGRLSDLRLLAKATVSVQSGLIRLPKQKLEQILNLGGRLPSLLRGSFLHVKPLFKKILFFVLSFALLVASTYSMNLWLTLLLGSMLPTMPGYRISKLNIHKNDQLPGIRANAFIIIDNQYPITISIPPVGFDVLIDNCSPVLPYIRLGNASTKAIDVYPHVGFNVSVKGDVQELPDALVNDCPETGKSPLDVLVGDYTHGIETRIYVECCSFMDPSTPEWARHMLKNVVVPLPLAGRTFNHLLKKFTFPDGVEFGMPSKEATPDSPQSRPWVSGKVRAVVALPDEMNFPINVTGIRADATIYYHKKLLGKLDLHKWQKSNSTREDDPGETIITDTANTPTLQHPSEHSSSYSSSLSVLDPFNAQNIGSVLLVDSVVEKAPVEVYDWDLLSEVAQRILFRAESVELNIDAQVDVVIETPLGLLTLRQLPGQGVVPIDRTLQFVNAIQRVITDLLSPAVVSSNGSLSALNTTVKNLQIVETTPNSLLIQGNIDFTNPTNYTARVPYMNINFLKNQTVLGHGLIENISIMPGRNKNVTVSALWEPAIASGEAGAAVGRELLSQYLSGMLPRNLPHMVHIITELKATIRH
jgi:hypothetical protein